MEPGIRRYKKEFEYSYTLGPFPTFELLESRPDLALEVCVSPAFNDKEKLFALCAEKSIPCRLDQKTLDRISNKEVAYAACKFRKFESKLAADRPHVMLVNPSDMGNLGTIERTMLAFGVRDLAIVEPCADPFNPKAVRASMGAAFSLNVRHFDSFEQYRAQYPLRRLFPFMLTGAVPLDEAVQKVDGPFSLVFGNEASGLPDAFAQMGVSTLIPHSHQIDSLNLAIAAGIGMYAFTRR